MYYRAIINGKHLYTIIHEFSGVWEKLDIGSQELAWKVNVESITYIQYTYITVS